MRTIRFLLICISLCTSATYLSAQSIQEVCPGDPPQWCWVEGSPFSDYEWWIEGGEILEQEQNRVLVRWNAPGTFRLRTLEKSALGCIGDTIVAKVLVGAQSDGDCHPTIKPVNIFTPNGDGRNDVFKLEGEYIVIYELSIFNRWGKLVFKTNEPQGAWDGNVNGQAAPSGVYFWVVNYGNQLGKGRDKGFVELMR